MIDTILPIYICVLSSTTFTYSYVFILEFFWPKWMWSDPNPFCASTSNSIYLSHMHSVETCQMSSLSPCQQKTQRQTFKSVFNAISLLPEYRRSWNDHPTIQACVGTWNNFQWVACMPCVLQMWTARGTCVIMLCCPLMSTTQPSSCRRCWASKCRGL